MSEKGSRKRGFTQWHLPSGPPEELEKAVDLLRPPQEFREKWYPRLHYAACDFLRYLGAERNAPRRKDVHDLLNEIGGWHGQLNNLDVTTFNHLANAMGSIGPGTLDDLVALLKQLRTAAAHLSATLPKDRGGSTNIVTEAHGTAHGQMIVDLIQRIEGGLRCGEVGPSIKITGGPGGVVCKVGIALCQYATGDDHTERVARCTRYAANSWEALKRLKDGTPEKAAELARLQAL